MAASLDSLLNVITGLPHDAVKSTLSAALDELTDDDITTLMYDWQVWARPNQLPPNGDWFIWLINAGRGFGKTRTGAEWIKALAYEGKSPRMALVGATAADMREIMIEGESGLLKIAHPRWRPVYEPSKRKLTWPNGCVCLLFTADEPDRLRGHNTDKAWCDEVGSWRYMEAWTNLLFGMRKGMPQIAVTTTPKPTALMRKIFANKNIVITRGTPYDNRDNLSDVYFREVIEPYEGTQVGRQEIHAEMLEDNEDALWKREWIDSSRIRGGEIPDLKRLIIAIDPAVTANKDSNETGIILAGKTQSGQAYVLEDLSGRYAPALWAQKAVALYDSVKADAIVAETNNGGDLVEAIIKGIDPAVKVIKVHASRGKIPRAEPVAALYERGFVHHVGTLADLESQLCNYDGESDYPNDRMDAVVWAIAELLLEQKRQLKVF